jgi:hypothetical protein
LVLDEGVPNDSIPMQISANHQGNVVIM